MLRFLSALLLTASAARADGVAGDFDYYVLSLSWSPNWCALEGDARQSPQCDPAEDFGWVLHGLWPQYETGWPDYCRTAFAPPSRAQTEGMADIMGTSGLAWHQWRKHGVCSGLDPAGYFALARDAHARVAIPQAFRRLSQQVSLPATLIEEAFVDKNPGLGAGAITVTCRSGYIQEVRICLTRELGFRPCGRDVSRDCTLGDALFDPVR
jgi:ribonuclease T2